MGIQLTPDLSRILKANYLLGSLDDVELSALIVAASMEHTPAEQAIVLEGQPASTLHVVLEGGVNVLKQEGQFLAYLGPGGFFGEMGLFVPNAVRTATCQAATDTRCLVLSHDVVHQFCSAWPASGIKVYRAIIGCLAERLQSTSSDLATLMAAQIRSQGGVDQAVRHARKARAAAAAHGGGETDGAAAPTEPGATRSPRATSAEKDRSEPLSED